MNLISTLWIVAGACALILAIDGALACCLPSWRARYHAPVRLVPFSVLMLAVAVGCFILGIYEARS
jgi:hypothetical protein